MSTSGNLALLIDGDNVSAKIIPGLMAEIASYGTASVRRIYADFTSPYQQRWKDVMLRHSILPIQAYSFTTGKNSTDGAMIIDAMDLLYTDRFASFCIVSSDSDFTRLAARIREQGVTVYGFGERKTNDAFIRACSKFVYFDVFTAPPADEPEQKPLGHVLDPPSTPARPLPFPSNSTSSAAASPLHRKPRPLDQMALNGLAQAIKSSPPYAEDDSYVNLAHLGGQLCRISPDLNARNYGYIKLWDFLSASGIVELKRQEMGYNKPPIALVRLK